MRMLTLKERETVSAAKAAIQALTSTTMEIMVTYTSKFVASGTYGGHRLNVILYPDAIHDLNDKKLPYDLSSPVSINGHLLSALTIDGGHIYRFVFNSG